MRNDYRKLHRRKAQFYIYFKTDVTWWNVDIAGGGEPTIIEPLDHMLHEEDNGK